MSVSFSRSFGIGKIGKNSKIVFDAQNFFLKG